MIRDAEQQQSRDMSNQSQGKKQVDGPDEPVVNEEEQNKAVNPEDKEHQLQTNKNDEKKGYATDKEKQETKEIKEENRSK